jgi:hypothetical protein
MYLLHKELLKFPEKYYVLFQNRMKVYKNFGLDPKHNSHLNVYV